VRILITGVLGVVGSSLKEHLLNKGHYVFGVDLYHSFGEIGYSQKMSNEINTYSRCDISEFRQIQRIFETNYHFDFVFNCGAEFGRWNGEDYYEQLWKSNVIGLKNILTLQEKYRFKLIHFSTSEVYGDYKDVMYEDVMDKFEIKQLNDYALSKWTNENQIKNSMLLDNTETVIVRLFNTYGPGEYYHPYRSVNCKFCYHAINGLGFDVFKGHSRTSTYIEDATRTISNIVDNFKNGSIYNIGSDQYHTIEELCDIICEYTNMDRSLINYKDSEKLTTKIKIPDISLSIKDLGFYTSHTLDVGVKKTIDWMLNNYKNK
jgi:dTDP-glucose 4,6-dehydratase